MMGQQNGVFAALANVGWGLIVPAAAVMSEQTKEKRAVQPTKDGHLSAIRGDAWLGVRARRRRAHSAPRSGLRGRVSTSAVSFKVVRTGTALGRLVVGVQERAGVD
jgi:hypothetical protein